MFSLCKSNKKKINQFEFSMSRKLKCKKHFFVELNCSGRNFLASVESNPIYNDPGNGFEKNWTPLFSFRISFFKAWYQS